MHSSHMGPHPLPGYTLDGETGPVNIEKNPSVLLLFLPRGPGAIIWGRGAGVLLGAAAEEAVWAGALGAAVPAQLGRGGAGPAWGVGPRHWSQEREEEGKLRAGNPPPALRASSCLSVLDRACWSHRVNLAGHKEENLEENHTRKHSASFKQ